MKFTLKQLLIVVSFLCILLGASRYYSEFANLMYQRYSFGRAMADNDPPVLQGVK